MNNFLGARVRTVIDQQHFKIRVGHSLESRETVLQRVGRLVGADDDRNSRPAAPLIVGKWTSCEYSRNRVEYRFRPSLDVTQTKRPIGNLVPTPPPVVRPTEDNRTARAFLVCGAQLHGGQRGLARLALAKAICAHFRQQKWSVPSDVVQVGYIRPKRRLMMQVHVEGTHVEKREVEIFRGWIVDVRQEAVGCNRFGFIVKISEKPLDSLPPVPPHDPRWNLIPQCEEQNSRMILERAHRIDNVSPNAAAQLAVVEKRHVLWPGNSNQRAEALSGHFIEKVRGGRCVESNRVDTNAGHEREVFNHAITSREL